MNQDLGISKGWVWVWRIAMIIVALFFLFDIVSHLLKPAPVVASFIQLGIPLSMSVPMAIILLVFLVLYCTPRTTVLGAIFLTGYLGGAVFANARIGASLFGATLFPIYMAILLWGSTYILEPRLRVLIPFRKTK